jgi:hypothetical protein
MATSQDYTACGEYERHFNTLQGGIRGLASAWILAACAGFSVLLLNDSSKTWLLDAPLLIAIMCFMATVGLALLWVLDQFIYQKLLGSVFLVGLRMEQLNSDLPPTRALMVHAFERRGASRLIEYFYIIPAALFALVTLGTRIIVLGPNLKLTQIEGWTVIVLFLAEVFLIVWMIRGAKRVPAQSQAAAMGDEFHALFTHPNRLEQLIMRNGSRLRIGDGAGGPVQHPASPHRRRATDDMLPDLQVRLLEYFHLSG